jgi:hypothetical protein
VEQDDDPVGCGVRQRAQQDRVHHAEDGRARGDPQGEDEDHGRGEPRRARERSQRVAEVAARGLEAGPRPHVAHSLLELFHASHLEERAPLGLFGRQARPDLLVGQLVHVAAHLRVEMAVGGISPEEGASEGSNARAEGHAFPIDAP